MNLLKMKKEGDDLYLVLQTIKISTVSFERSVKKNYICHR